MDIFGKKKHRRLEDQIQSQNQIIGSLEKRIEELKKPIEDHKNRYRTFVIYSAVKGPKFEVKARRFEHNSNGYYFYEVDKAYSRGVSSIVNGYLVGHISDKHVWRVEEKPE